MSTVRRRARVLHSMRAPGGETRYATHMAAMTGDEFEMSFFTWRRALVDDYEVFHLHWPEQLLGRESGAGAWLRWLRVRLLLARLRRRRTPVVYTLHNHRPHDRPVSSRLALMQREFEDLTRVEVHLVPEPDRVTRAVVADIPHGSYREPFAGHPRQAARPGRILTFGIIKPYKGIDRLLEAFASVADPGLSLRIVGEPADGGTVAAIDASVAVDPRVSVRYGFLPDSELVSEVSQAQLVVLPYRELHSSGAVLVALSLGRRVLVPSSPTAAALRDEVGPGWVQVFEPPLTPQALRRALDDPASPQEPDLDARTWAQVREKHTAVYRRALV